MQEKVESAASPSAPSSGVALPETRAHSVSSEGQSAPIWEGYSVLISGLLWSKVASCFGLSFYLEVVLLG